MYVGGKREAWRRKNGRITWKHGRDKGDTLRQMREEQGRGVIRRCLFLFAPGSIGTHGTGTIEISKEGVGCPSDTARNWYNGVRDKQSKDSPVV